MSLSQSINNNKNNSPQTNTTETVKIMGVNIVNVTIKSALDKISEFVSSEGLNIIYTPNSEIIMAANRDSSLVEILNNADLTVADGAGVVIASKILGSPLPERVAGFDLINAMFADPRFKNSSYFLFGTKHEIIEKAAEKLRETHNLNIVGVRDGYFSPSDEDKIINEINASKADILLVALGAPRQERWIYDNRNKLNVRLAIGIGGSFDVIAGVSKRAPLIYQKCNLEWFYRLCKEPWRYKRMLDLPRFMIQILKFKFSGKKTV